MCTQLFDKRLAPLGSGIRTFLTSEFLQVRAEPLPPMAHSPAPGRVCAHGEEGCSVQTADGGAASFFFNSFIFIFGCVVCSLLCVGFL